MKFRTSFLIRQIKITCLFIFFFLSKEIFPQQVCFSTPGTVLYSSGGTDIRDIKNFDFNDDRIQDIIVSNAAGPDYSILLSDGLGGFQMPIDIPNGGATSFVLADFNQDGNIDIATNVGSILFGSGQFTFNAPVKYNFAGAPDKIDTADLNNDNILDLVANESNGIIQVLLGLGNGLFTNKITTPAGNQDFFISDVDNDGIKDILSCYNDFGNGISKIFFLKGSGNGNFSSTVILNLNIKANDVFLEDLNNDGKKDMIVIHSANDSISIYENTGNLQFSLSNRFYCGGYPNSPTLYDLNYDGIKDLIVSLDGPNSTRIYQGFGNFQYGNEFTLLSSVNPDNYIVADINNDNRADIVVPSIYSGQGYVHPLLNCMTISGMKEKEKEDLLIFINNENMFIKNNLVDHAELTISDVLGKIVKKATLIFGENQISMNSLADGIYFYNIIGGKRHLYSGKIMMN